MQLNETVDDNEQRVQRTTVFLFYLFCHNHVRNGTRLARWFQAQVC